jgi:SAM-dependent methyltransferase
MKARLLDHLACPSCRTSLIVREAIGPAGAADEIENGALVCPDCSEVYSIRSGIPRFPLASRLETADAVRRTRRTYDFTWSRFAAAEIEDGWEKDSYAYTALIPPNVFEGAGKVGLDAGCGGGADLRRFWQRGIRVIGFDVSSGVDAIRQMNAVPPHGDLVQGDLHMLPFKTGTFDFIYSFGVLHHLPEPERGFAALTAALKPGAPLVTYLYERFDQRASAARAMLGMVSLVRRVSNRMPPSLLHVFCWMLVPVVWLAFAVPARVISVFSGRRAARWPFSHTIRWPVLAADLYDRFAPPVEHRLTEQEVRDLYARCGLERVEVRRHRGWVSWGYRPDHAAQHAPVVASTNR